MINSRRRATVSPDLGGTTNLRQVAKKAGYHASTVSRAFTRPELLRDQTRDHILAVADELGYRPNLVARALANRTTPLVPLVVPDITNPFFARLASDIDKAAQQQGLHLLLCSSGEDPADEVRCLEDLLPLQVPFAIVAPLSDENMHTFEELSKQMPIVLIDHAPDSARLPSVSIDNSKGIQLALQHLTDLGHHAVGFVAGPQASATARQRLDGYLTWTRGFDIKPVVYEGGFTIESGNVVAQRILSESMEVTALVAANDLAAIGLMSKLIGEGVPVPGKLSIVGFDDLTIASHFRPSLTTVHQPTGEIGATALSIALRLIGSDASPGETMERLILEPSLVQRESTGPVGFTVP